MINVGTKAKPIYYLAELCTLLPGQPVKTKLESNESQSMIDFACRAAPENALSITTLARNILGLGNNKLLVSFGPRFTVRPVWCGLLTILQKDFGITVDKNLVTVKARELMPPIVSYRKGNALQAVTPAEGGWLMKGVTVCKAGRRITTWTYVAVGQAVNEMRSRNDDLSEGPSIHEGIKEFPAFLRTGMGMTINQTPSPPKGYATNGDGEGELRKVFEAISGQRPRPELVVLLILDKNPGRYTRIKKIADVDFGIPTICMRGEMVTKIKGRAGYFANVGLKVNLKFGGINHQIRDDTRLMDKTLFVGYDVTHPTNLPSGVGENAPSLVGLVANIDQHLAQWPAVAWENPRRAEMVANDGGQFVKHFKDRIQLWAKNNNARQPEKIIIFRDGVSEGQFRLVLDHELPHIRQACREVYGAKVPPITLLVSVKRHQTRFYPTDADRTHHESRSPKQGTVVDRGITNVRYWDFFLQAHAAIQGKPPPLPFPSFPDFGAVRCLCESRRALANQLPLFVTGTARPAHYTVLVDEIFRKQHKEKAADVLEKLTHDMCYAYGRATKAVSICPPAYYADLVCRRARIHKNEFFDDVGSVASGLEDAISRRTIHPSLKDTMYYI